MRSSPRLASIGGLPLSHAYESSASSLATTLLSWPMTSSRLSCPPPRSRAARGLPGGGAGRGGGAVRRSSARAVLGLASGCTWSGVAATAEKRPGGRGGAVVRREVRWWRRWWRRQEEEAVRREGGGGAVAPAAPIGGVITAPDGVRGAVRGGGTPGGAIAGFGPEGGGDVEGGEDVGGAASEGEPGGEEGGAAAPHLPVPLCAATAASCRASPSPAPSLRSCAKCLAALAPPSLRS